MAEVRLLTGGLAYAGWTGVRLRRSMDTVCGGFELQVTELWPGAQQRRSIRPGESCQLEVDGEVLLTGWVDEVSIEHDATRHMVRVTGRDKTGDLVDCSAVGGTGQWKARTILQIATDLCAPFGIKVSADVDVGKAIPSFAIEPGEKVFDALERLARIRALLMVSDGRGGLVFTRAGVQRIADVLQLGRNLLRARGSFDMRDRFSQYRAKGQAAGNDFVNGKAASAIAASAVDPGVKRYRPLVLVGDAQDVAVSLQQRVNWEANVRAARSTRVDVMVQGWRHAAGLWQPNRIVHVVDEWLDLDHDLLLTEVEFELSDQGTLAALGMTRVDAFSLLPVKVPVAQGPVRLLVIPKTAEGSR